MHWLWITFFWNMCLLETILLKISFSCEWLIKSVSSQLWEQLISGRASRVVQGPRWQRRSGSRWTLRGWDALGWRVVREEGSQRGGFSFQSSLRSSLQILLQTLPWHYVLWHWASHFPGNSNLRQRRRTEKLTENNRAGWVRDGKKKKPLKKLLVT